jgi:hypothetical protein
MSLQSLVKASYMDLLPSQTSTRLRERDLREVSSVHAKNRVRAK